MSWINLDALWKIVVLGLVAGAGLPALFAIGMLALSRGPKTATAGADSDVVIGGNPYVLIYSRVAVHNPTSQALTVDPQPSPGLVPLNNAPDQVSPGATVDHDYAVAEDRFGGTYAWPTAAQLAVAGSYNAHFAHMRAFWNGQLAGITQLTLPDPQLVDAYLNGF